MAGRTKKAALNIGSNLIVQILKTILSFVTRTVFIYCLGQESLGLNGLFTNILSMLSLAELGVGTAINFSLYEPLAKNDTKKISVLMTFYKKAYMIIGTIVLILGIILIPFLHIFIRDIVAISDVYIIYLLFLANTVSSYFISYKETLLAADQKNYKLTKINTLFLFISSIVQIIILIIFKKFVIYLLSQFILQLIQKIFVNKFISNEYKNVSFNSCEKIDDNDMKLIEKNVKAMVFHKIGDYCINGTDNLIISSFINIVTVGIYSNYLTILSLLTAFTTLFFNNLTSSIGNLLVTESNEKKYEIFKKINFVGFVMYGYCSVILINVFNDFITLWVGKEYCFNFWIVLSIVISFYITGQRIAPHTLKSAAGLYDIDKFTPLIQSVINLVVSIVLVQYIGILGVILGTIVSSLAVPSWQRPYIVYKYVLNKPFIKYLHSYIKNIILLAIITLISYFIGTFIFINNLFVIFILKIMITSIIYGLIICIFYRKSDEFKYFYEFLINIVRRKLKWKKA